MFKGSNVALITPFKDNGNLDEEDLCKINSIIIWIMALVVSSPLELLESPRHLSHQRTSKS
jgi:hypothetical protein